MSWPPISKSAADWKVRPNLWDYAQSQAQFSWQDTERELRGLPEGSGINIAWAAVDRHLAGGRGDHLAIRWLGKTGEVRDFTYANLTELTNRFANVLDQLEV